MFDNLFSAYVFSTDFLLMTEMVDSFRGTIPGYGMMGESDSSIFTSLSVYCWILCFIVDGSLWSFDPEFKLK